MCSSSQLNGFEAYTSFATDEDGRFTSEDDDHRSSRSVSRSSRSSNNSNDEDESDQGSKIQRLSSRSSSASTSDHPGRGWHGDSEGHAKARSHSHDNVGLQSKLGRKSSSSSTKKVS